MVVRCGIPYVAADVEHSRSSTPTHSSVSRMCPTASCRSTPPINQCPAHLCRAGRSVSTRADCLVLFYRVKRIAWPLTSAVIVVRFYLRYLRQRFTGRLCHRHSRVRPDGPRSIVVRIIFRFRVKSKLRSPHATVLFRVSSSVGRLFALSPSLHFPIDPS